MKDELGFTLKDVAKAMNLHCQSGGVIDQQPEIEPPGRPFPWFCPRCRRKEVRRVTIPYQCQRRYEGQPITLVISGLAVPQCQNCGELVFDYVAEEQINQAFEEQTAGLLSGGKSSAVADLLDMAKQLPAQGRVHVVTELAVQLSADEQAVLVDKLLAQLPDAARQRFK